MDRHYRKPQELEDLIDSWRRIRFGSRPSKAARWHASTVKSILCSARIFDQRTHDPRHREVGNHQGGRTILGPGNWEATITAEQSERIRAFFANPDRPVGKSAKSMLAGIVTCGKCGNTPGTGGWRKHQTAPSK